MPTYEYNKEYAKKYLGKLDEIKLRIPKGQKSTVEARAKENGESVNGYINGLLRADLGLTEEEWKEGAKDGSSE